MSRAEIPTDAVDFETFLSVTVISNGTPGSTVSYGRLNVASIGCGCAAAASAVTGSATKSAKATGVSFMTFSFTEQTGPDAYGFRGIRSAMRRWIAVRDGIWQFRWCAAPGRHRH